VVCGVEEGVYPVKFYLLYLERVLFIVACEKSLPSDSIDICWLGYIHRRRSDCKHSPCDWMSNE
jgi:hypothetical protein